jgi:hypothetical protein
VNFLKVVLSRSDELEIMYTKAIFAFSSIFFFAFESSFAFFARAMNRRQIVSRCGDVQKTRV